MCNLVKNKKEMERRRIVELNNQHIHNAGLNHVQKRPRGNDKNTVYTFGQKIGSRESSFVKKTKIIKENQSLNHQVRAMELLK